jgi:hypothetical protein
MQSNQTTDAAVALFGGAGRIETGAARDADGAVAAVHESGEKVGADRAVTGDGADGAVTAVAAVKKAAADSGAPRVEDADGVGRGDTEDSGEHSAEEPAGAVEEGDSVPDSVEIISEHSYGRPKGRPMPVRESAMLADHRLKAEAEWSSKVASDGHVIGQRGT